LGDSEKQTLDFYRNAEEEKRHRGVKDSVVEAFEFFSRALRVVSRPQNL
jgi:hypothetical protein